MASVEGLDRVVRNLNEQIGRIEMRTRTGLLVAGMEVRKVALPITPVDTGALRRSSFVRSGMTGRLNPFVTIGYRQSYAIFVHEIDKNYRVGGWKFLERAVRISRRRILETIRRFASVKG